MFDKQSAASEMLMEHIYEDLIFETSEKRTEELLQKLSSSGINSVRWIYLKICRVLSPVF